MRSLDRRRFLALITAMSLLLVWYPHYAQAAFVIPANYTTSIAAGTYHTVAIKSDGTVWSWGRNNEGQLGDGTTADSTQAVQVKAAGGAAFTGVKAVEAGSYHTIALKEDGTVWSWGTNFFGALGNGSEASRSAFPVQATDLADVIAVAGGAYHSIALTTGGKVWTWGLNSFGQLGDGTSTDRSAPRQVMTDAAGNAFEDVAAIAGGASHSLALKTDGTVWAWGYNRSGQLGAGTTEDSRVPVQVTGFTDPVIAIAAGPYYSVALDKNGNVWRWGDNLGDGEFNPLSPKRFPEMDGGVALAAEGNQIIVIKQGGTLWRWGSNGVTLPGAPAAAMDGTGSVITGFIAAAGGESHSAALTNDGKVWTWGDNYYGQLGNGTTLNGYSTLPVPVFDLEWSTTGPDPDSRNAELSGLAVSAGELAPAFASGTKQYSVSVTNATYSLNVTPTASDPGASIFVNDIHVPSGHESEPIPLAIGLNTILITVKAADESTENRYLISVQRSAPEGISPFARLIADKSAYRAGEPAEVRLTLDGFPEGARVNHAHFYLKYDASAFELATHNSQNDIVDGEIPSDAKFDSDVPGTIAYTVFGTGSGYPIANGATVFTVRLKVKPGASVGTHTFTLIGDNPDLSASLRDLGETEYRIPSVTATVTVAGEQPSPPSAPPPPHGPATKLPAPWLTDNQPYMTLNPAARLESINGQLLVRLDREAALPLVEAAPLGASLFTIGVDFPGTAVFEIPSAVAKAIYEKTACSGWILVHTPAGSYTLPLPVLNGDEGLEDGAVTKIAISPGDLAISSRIADAAKADQVVLLPSPAVDYTLTVTLGGETKTIENLGDVYVERTMNLGDKVNVYPPQQIKPVIFRFDGTTGTLEPTPARFITDGSGALQAVIKRTGNSTYVAGYPAEDEKSDPGEPITRGEFAARLIRALGLQDKAVSGSFADVRESDKFGREILVAGQKRLIFGSNDRFRPNDKLTREEMAVIIGRAIDYVVPNGTFAQTNLASFRDASRISSWASYAVRIAAANGILTGDSSQGLRPGDYSTREQAVIALARMLQLLSLSE